MTNGPLPPHLERLGRQLAAAAHDLSAPTRRPQRFAFRVAAAGTLSLAAVATAVVLAVGATTGTPPAYALSTNGDGSVTVTINDIATAVPALNARFAAMGVDETVVPVQADCPTHTMGGLFVDPQQTTSSTLTFGPGRKYLAPGTTGVVAAEQLPNGVVALAVGAIKPPVPSCFSKVAYTLHTTGVTNGTPTVTAIPVNPPTSTNPGG